MDLIKLLRKLGILKMLETRGLISNESNPSLTTKGYELIGEELEWVKDWIKLWPTNLEKQIGYSVSGNSESCTVRMKKFLAKQDFDKETIFEATKLYLKNQELNDWQFTKKNYKFISDIKSSTLEDYCKKIKEGFSEDDLSRKFDYL